MNDLRDKADIPPLPRWWRRILFLLLALLPIAGTLSAGQAANEYEKVRLRYYKKEQLITELLADRAQTSGETTKAPAVQLERVTILVYDTLSDPSSVEDKPPPLRARITSDTGAYCEMPPDESGVAEKVAHLKGNVQVFRYLALPSSSPPPIDATVNCDNATYYHLRQLLSGTGYVKMTQRDTCVIEGEDFTYRILREGTHPGETVIGLETDFKEMGGWFEFGRNITMIITRPLARKKKEETSSSAKNDERSVITCQGPARYNIDTGEALFQNRVVVTRQRMELKCDFLRVRIHPETHELLEILAWSEDRGKVSIRGIVASEHERLTGGGTPFLAHAKIAHYDEQTGELLLTDDRPRRLPLLEYGGSRRISDQRIRFDTRKNILRTEGGQGFASLQAPIALPAGTAKEANAATPTEITYTQGLEFDHEKHTAIFRGNIQLKHDTLILTSDLLTVHLDPQGPADREGLRIAKVVAGREEGSERPVIILREGKRAVAAQAVLTPSPPPSSLASEGLLLRETLVLTGPPNPQVEEPGGFFEARQLSIERIQRIGDPAPQSMITAPGPGSCVFDPKRDREEEKTDASSPPLPEADPTMVRFGKVMIYDETNNLIRFQGDVVATNGDQVLHSEEVIVEMAESEEKNEKQETRKTIRRLSAVGDAKLHWGIRHCEGERVVREIHRARNLDRITLFGTKERPAVVWEEKGNRFVAPVITAESNGRQIHANGGGELVMIDGSGEGTAVVTYKSGAVYTGKEDGTGQVVFNENVEMRRKDMLVKGDQMITVLEGGSEQEVADLAIEMPRGVGHVPSRVREVTVLGSVVIRQMTRVAFGERGNVLLSPEGDVITLEGASKGNRAEIRDSEGLRMLAPRITLKQASGIVQATGPGEVHVAGGGETARLALGADIPPSEAKVDYILYYDGSFVYNALARRIRFEENVRLVQENVRGRCDVLSLILSKTPEIKTEADLESVREQVRILAIEAQGKVRFRRFEPADPNDPISDPTLRLGKTVFTQSEEAYYDVEQRTILLSGGPPKPQAIQQVTKGDRNQRVSSRVRFQAGKIWIDVATGDVKMRETDSESVKYIPSAGPIRFED